jgi:hypothetical protein
MPPDALTQERRKRIVFAACRKIAAGPKNANRGDIGALEDAATFGGVGKRERP